VVLRKKRAVVTEVLHHLVGQDHVEVAVGIRPGISGWNQLEPMLPRDVRELFRKLVDRFVEGAVDLARLAGYTPAGVVCEVLNEDGTMAHVSELFAFAQHFNLKMTTLGDVVRYRLRHEHHIKRAEETELNTPYGAFRAITYESCLDGRQHVILTAGAFSPDEPALVRVHSQCVAGDVFGSHLCHCQAHLHEALARVAQARHGAVLYLQPKVSKIRLKPQEDFPRKRPLPFEMSATHRHTDLDLQDYGIGVQILRDVGIDTVRLLTTNSDKLDMLEQYGVMVVEQVPPTR
jgi:3,4-dihydroxy 2-butanone 4-phosphate synthase / GTP cyclohydrolase II